MPNGSLRFFPHPPPPAPTPPSAQAKLLEHNVRFGDPECQSLMVRLQSDLLESLQAQCRGEEVRGRLDGGQLGGG